MPLAVGCSGEKPADCSLHRRRWGLVLAGAGSKLQPLVRNSKYRLHCHPRLALHKGSRPDAGKWGSFCCECARAAEVEAETTSECLSKFQLERSGWYYCRQQSLSVSPPSSQSARAARRPPAGAAACAPPPLPVAAAAPPPAQPAASPGMCATCGRWRGVLTVRLLPGVP